jgi:hypothetical protein
MNFLDEEFHNGEPIYCTSSMKKFIDENGKVSQEEFNANNPRPSTRNIGAKDGFEAVPSTPAGPVTVEMADQTKV